MQTCETLDRGSWCERGRRPTRRSWCEHRRLVTRRAASVARQVSLPFLDEQDEARVIAAVVVVVCHAMAEGNDIGALCEPSCAHTRHLVVDVLLKVSVCECA